MITDSDPLVPTKKLLLTYRFVTDAVGHFLGSYAAFGMSYVIDNVSHTPSKFSHWAALSFAASLISVDYIFGKKWGSSEWFGLISLSVATIVGYTIFFVLTLVVSGLTAGFGRINDSFIGWLLGSPIFLIPAIAVPLVVRLMAAPVVWVFRRKH